MDMLIHIFNPVDCQGIRLSELRHNFLSEIIKIKDSLAMEVIRFHLTVGLYNDAL